MLCIGQTTYKGRDFLITADSQAPACPMQSVSVLSGDEQVQLRVHAHMAEPFACVWTPQVQMDMVM